MSHLVSPALNDLAGIADSDCSHRPKGVARLDMIHVTESGGRRVSEVSDARVCAIAWDRVVSGERSINFQETMRREFDKPGEWMLFDREVLQRLLAAASARSCDRVAMRVVGGFQLALLDDGGDMTCFMMALGLEGPPFHPAWTEVTDDCR